MRWAPPVSGEQYRWQEGRSLERGLGVCPREPLVGLATPWYAVSWKLGGTCRKGIEDILRTNVTY